MEQLTTLKVYAKMSIDLVEQNKKEIIEKMDEQIKEFEQTVIDTPKYFELKGGINWYKSEIIKADAKIFAYKNMLDMIEGQILETEYDAYLKLHDGDYSLEKLFG